MKKGFNIETAKFIGKAVLFTLIVFNILSFVLSRFFDVFKEITSAFSLGWLVIILTIILWLVFRLVGNIKSFDRKSIFILLIALAILLFIVIKFNLDFGKLFDMSLVRNDLASLIP